jgi:hypothetical protein
MSSINISVKKQQAKNRFNKKTTSRYNKEFTVKRVKTGFKSRHRTNPRNGMLVRSNFDMLAIHVEHWSDQTPYIHRLRKHWLLDPYGDCSTPKVRPANLIPDLCEDQRGLFIFCGDYVLDSFKDSDISDAEKKKIRSAWTLLSLCTGNCYGTILKIVQRKTELSHYNTINSLIHMVISQLPQSTINTIAKQYFKPAK